MLETCLARGIRGGTIVLSVLIGEYLAVRRALPRDQRGAFFWLEACLARGELGETDGGGVPIVLTPHAVLSL